MLSFVVLLGGAHSAVADQTYLLNNYPGEQDGGTLSGHITVSDTAADDGLLTAGEIVSWRFTLTDAGAVNSVTTDSATAANPLIILLGEVQITASDILIAAPGASDVAGLKLTDTDGASTTFGILEWQRSDSPPFGTEDNYRAEDLRGTSIANDDVTYWENSGAPFALGGSDPSDPWVIATVPEPSSAVLLSLAAAPLLRRRRRRVGI